MIDSQEERLGKFRRNRAKFPRVWFYRRSRDKVGANVEKARNTGIASNLFPSSLFSSGRGTDRSPFRGLKYFLRRVGARDILIYGQDGVCPGRNNFDSRLCPVSREHTLTLNKFLLARNSIVYFPLSKHSSRREVGDLSRILYSEDGFVRNDLKRSIDSKIIISLERKFTEIIMRDLYII